jgi:hypothetical protein
MLNYLQLIYLAQYGVKKRVCEHGYETSGSIKGGEIISQLSYYFLLEKDCFL